MHHQTTRKPQLISQSTRNPVTHIGIVNIPRKHFNDRGVHSVAAPLREGKNQNEKTFGIPAEEIFQAIYRSPLTLLSPVLLYCRKCLLLLKPSLPLRCCRSEEEMLKFMGLMNSSWVLDGHDIATAFNLSSFHSVVDLGGRRSNFIVFL